MTRECGSCTLTVERVFSLLEYDPALGLFKWKHPNAHQAKGWFRGNKSVRQYRRLYIDGRHYLAHVIAFVLKRGQWPENEIDHKDHDQGNNKWDNLRPATRKQNSMNRRVGVNNKTGVRGVSVFLNGNGTVRYRASITVDHKRISLGLFDTVAAAREVRRAAERGHYGDFA